MQKALLSFFYTCLLFSLTTLEAGFYPLIKRARPITLKTSILVPCAPSHFRYIQDLLTDFEHQTTPPDEVVISLSEYEKVPAEEIEILHRHSWPFSLKIIKSAEKNSAGKNRNVAFRHSTGDLIITQDADDLSHPQRVELIKHYFENYKVDHLTHMYGDDYESFVEYDLNTLQAYYAPRVTALHAFKCTHGAIAFLRNVGELVRWPEYFHAGEDYEFNSKVYSLYGKTVFLRANLYAYRISLSTRSLDKNQ